MRIIILNSDNDKFEASAYYNTELRQQQQNWSQCVLNTEQRQQELELKPVYIIILNSDNNKTEASVYYNTEQRQQQNWSQCVL